jgi:hypothetical protein
MVTTGTEAGRAHEASVIQAMNKYVTVRKIGCDIGTENSSYRVIGRNQMRTNINENWPGSDSLVQWFH